MSRYIQIISYPRSGSILMLSLMYGSVSNFKVHATEASASTYAKVDYNTMGKRPTDIREMAGIEAQYKRAGKELSWLFVQRDIRSVMTSFHHNIPKDYFIGWDYVYRVAGMNDGYKEKTGIKYMKGIMDTAKAMQSNICVVKYEDLLKSPDYVQDKIKTELAVDFTTRFSNIDENLIPDNLKQGGITVKLDPSRREKWMQHKLRIIEEFNKFPEMFDVLIEEGYEDNRDWFDEI